MAVLSVEFDPKIYSVLVLQSALYRIIGIAVGKIRAVDQILVCDLTVVDDKFNITQVENRFLELVADEALREHLSLQTEPLRNVILSLAFGSLAFEENITT